MRGSEALRWDCKPVYNLERTLNNEGDDPWSETKAKATDVGTTSLFGSMSYVYSMGLQGVLWGKKGSLVRYIYRALHAISWPALEGVWCTSTHKDLEKSHSQEMLCNYLNPVLLKLNSPQNGPQNRYGETLT